MAAITISNLRISPYTQKNTIKPVYGDTLTLTFTLPEPFVDGDDYILALDYERVLVPTARPLCAMTSEYTIDGGDITFALELRTARFRDWVSTIKKPMPVWLQIQRKRDGVYDTILLDDVLALPSVADGDNTVFPGDPLEELLDGKLDKPTEAGKKGDVLKLGADGEPVWDEGGGGGGGSQVQSDWDESDSSEPSYIQHKPTIPAPQEQSDWDESDSSDVAYIRHKPALDYIPASEKGAANGVAGLDGNGLVPRTQLPYLEWNTSGQDAAGAVKLNHVTASGGLSIINGFLVVRPAGNNEINLRSTTNKMPIVVSNLDYAVRSVLPNVTVIPAATTEYSLVDASATTNNHSWQYFHAPAEASTYTLPAVTDTTVAHRIKLTLDFTTVQTYAFEDSEGTAIVPLFTPTIAAGDVYEFDCEYSSVKAQWLVWPHKQGAVSDDYVMQSNVGAANGAASLGSDGYVPSAQLALSDSGSITHGAGSILGYTSNGYTTWMGRLQFTDANASQIESRNNYIVKFKQINAAVTAALTDANKIQLTDAQKASAQDTLGAAPATLHLAAAPTTATVGAFGQRAIVDSTGKAYTCTAATNTGTEAEPVWSYTWTDDANAVGNARFYKSLRIGPRTQWGDRVTGTNTLTIAPASSYGFGGNQTNALGIGQFEVYGNQSNILILGVNVSVGGSNQAVIGKHGIAKDGPLNLGIGHDGNNRRNGLEATWSGDLYIAGGHQQGITVIPAATTEYTLAEGVQSHIPDSAPTYTLPTVTDAARSHEVILTILFRGYYRYSTGDSGSAYCWKANDGSLLYTDTTSITAGTTVAYSDTALTESAGAIALYDSGKTAFALVGSYSFEDADGNDITPLSTPTIEVGSVVTFLCRWEALLSKWVIMPIPLNPSYDDEPSSSGGGGGGGLTATGGSMDFTGLNGTWTQAGTTTASGTTAPYYTIEYGGTTYYVSLAYSSFEGSVVWAITTYSLESEASDWPPNINEACMAYASSSAASPVGLAFTPTYNYEGNCPTFSA